MWLNILLVFVALCFIILCIIKRFVYFQPTFEYLQPRDSFQEIHEGNLHAWYKQGTTGKVILFCHGNGGNLTHRQDKLIALSKPGHAVLIFDYSGYGQSTGVPSELLCYANASMFVELLLSQGYKRENIVMYGESLGGAVAAHVARKYNLSYLILESSIPSVKELIKHRYKFLSFLTPLFYEFDTSEYLVGYKGKTLVLHSKEDEIIPYSIMDKIINNCTLHIPITGTHNNLQIPWEKIHEFINS